jgi:3-oxoacyl-[acyl-carrier protein] reductase
MFSSPEQAAVSDLRSREGRPRQAITSSQPVHLRAFDLSEIDAIPDFVKALRDAFGAIYGR